MAITSTTLASAMAAGDMTINVTSATGFAAGNVIRIDSEWMVQTAAAVSTVVPVRRGGQNGSTQVAHTVLAPVVTCLASDTLNSGPGAILNPATWAPVITSIGVSTTSGTFEVNPICNTLTFLDKATAAAILITSPSGLVDGTEWTFYSNTAAAHTITYTPGFNADTTSSDVATFAATKGNSITLIAAKGLWGLKCASGVTVG